MSATLLYEATDGLARITIAQDAKMNAMTFEMWSALPGLISRAAAGGSGTGGKNPPRAG